MTSPSWRRWSRCVRDGSGSGSRKPRHHFEASWRPGDAGSGLRRGYDSQELAVGFVDLVDSTRLAQQLSTAELGDALGEFEARAADTIVTQGGRLVKLIGDEVMYVV